MQIKCQLQIVNKTLRVSCWPNKGGKFKFSKCQFSEIHINVIMKIQMLLKGFHIHTFSFSSSS